MEIKQEGSQACRTEQGNVTSSEQHFLQDSTSKISRIDKSSQLITNNQKSSQNTRKTGSNSKKCRLNGGSLTFSKSYDVKVPRTPNVFIIYHRTKSKELAKIKTKAQTASDERHPWQRYSAKASDFDSKDASQVPLEHRKQASMESAFSV
ncbi:883_t:CDS:2 [Cetraspora pellucida]|uniref:883_t:CDS:1 n=1 Tax=Cetraspora pellucida TaxID=1433469 RepID=A0A9N8ZQ53_9GLOM|nr:883_t:CDS:2 [Cetraspora pellucida]